MRDNGKEDARKGGGGRKNEGEAHSRYQFFRCGKIGGGGGGGTLTVDYGTVVANFWFRMHTCRCLLHIASRWYICKSYLNFVIERPTCRS